ncbi:hypothetical protein FPN185_contig00110-0002 [Flavobacterium psychrophilum]|nr:hypothetical protein [Flavobacterium psychrophilum]GEJ34757.1 hypothetical protein FPN185_contig00110-0002 [Flavobacterium psychrophilum]
MQGFSGIVVSPQQKTNKLETQQSRTLAPRVATGRYGTVPNRLWLLQS